MVGADLPVADHRRDAAGLWWSRSAPRHQHRGVRSTAAVQGEERGGTGGGIGGGTGGIGEGGGGIGRGMVGVGGSIGGVGGIVGGIGEGVGGIGLGAGGYILALLNVCLTRPVWLSVYG